MNNYALKYYSTISINVNCQMVVVQSPQTSQSPRLHCIHHSTNSSHSYSWDIKTCLGQYLNFLLVFFHLCYSEYHLGIGAYNAGLRTGSDITLPSHVVLGSLFVRLH